MIVVELQGRFRVITHAHMHIAVVYVGSSQIEMIGRKSFFV
jgi:hypothetical protein